MYAGQLLEIGTAQEIHHEPSHPYTKGLLNSFPSLRGPRRELAGIPGSPPDLRDPPPGCPFLPRCGYGTAACEDVDMHLLPVATSRDPEHVTACPFVLPGHAAPPRSRQRRRRPPGSWEHDRADADADIRGRRHAGRSPWRRSRSARTSGSAGARSLHAVRDVSFNLYRGAVVALVGESGSGKSTAARLLAGQERLTSGAIQLDGKPVEVASRSDFRQYKSQVQSSSRTRSPR